MVYIGGHACPRCGSRDVQLAVRVEELSDDHPLIEEMKRLADDDKKTEPDEEKD